MAITCPSKSTHAPPAKKRARPGTDRAKPQSSPKRRKQDAYAPERPDDRSVEINSASLKPTLPSKKTSKPSKIKSFSNSTSLVIDLTLDDDLDDGSRTNQSRCNGQVSVKKRRRSQYGSHDARSEHGARPLQTQLSKTSLFGKSMKKQSAEKVQKERYGLTNGYQQTTKPAVAAPAGMFTVADAITALAKPSNAKLIAYDVPTGEHLSYPMERSYHLSAMGRYGVKPSAAEAKLDLRTPADTQRRLPWLIHD